MVPNFERLIIVDFDDSFTFNLAGEFYLRGIKSSVVSYRNLNEIYNFVKKNKHEVILLWGPGPGHPQDYPQALSYLKKLLKHPHVFHFGVCLGHQLISQVLGLKVKRSLSPAHGRRFPFCIPAWSCFDPRFVGKTISVQRYNSLTPKCSTQEQIKLRQSGVQTKCLAGELWALFAQNIISYQFHPESVGTSHKSLLFGPVVSFFYNKIYVEAHTSRRNLRFRNPQKSQDYGDSRLSV